MAELFTALKSLFTNENVQGSTKAHGSGIFSDNYHFASFAVILIH